MGGATQVREHTTQKITYKEYCIYCCYLPALLDMCLVSLQAKQALTVE